jgi:hypothetical protein
MLDLHVHLKSLYTKLLKASENELSSKNGLDYRHLQCVLKAGIETSTQMLNVIGKDHREIVSVKDHLNFPSRDSVK